MGAVIQTLRYSLRASVWSKNKEGEGGGGTAGSATEIYMSIFNDIDVLHLNLRNWSAKTGNRTKWANSTSFVTRVQPLLYFWIDYITAKTKNQLFRQNPAQTQGSVTISNEKKTYNTIQFNTIFVI